MNDTSQCLSSLVSFVAESGNGHDDANVVHNVVGGTNDEAHSRLAKGVYAPLVSRLHYVFGDGDA